MSEIKARQEPCFIDTNIKKKILKGSYSGPDTDFGTDTRIVRARIRAFVSKSVSGSVRRRLKTNGSYSILVTKPM
jgi:hypothetical protein